MRQLSKLRFAGERVAHARVHTLAGVLAVVGAGCADPGAPETSVAESEIRVCADGPTVEGIDVSKWQGEIDWDAVAGDGIGFAFIRTSHGLGILDEWYDFNWSEARRVGVRRGTYQYFSPADDAIAQADLLLERMGPLEDGDLPPVLDVEASDGLAPEAIVAAIHAWSDRVTEVLGVAPIIYTAKYFWQDSVGAPDDFLDQSLWVANYGVECPLIADPWPRWDFWQYTSTGAVAGISGNVDRDVWNGTEEDLAEYAWPPPADPPPDDPPPDDPPPDDPPGDPPGDLASGCQAAPGGAGGGAALLALAALVSVRARRRRAATR